MRYIAVFIISGVLWFFLAWPVDFNASPVTYDLAGLVLTGIVGLFSSLYVGNYFSRGAKKAFNPLRWFWFIIYIPYFIWYVIIANLDVVYRVLHPKMPIKPGIVKVKTTLSRPSAISALANSITLTPGTLTVDYDPDGYLYVHWIYVKGHDIEENTKLVVEKFEKILRRIFE